MCHRFFYALYALPVLAQDALLVTDGYHSLAGGWAIDGERIVTPEAFLRIALAPIHSGR